LLAEAGTDKTRILKAYIYLSDMAHFAGMNSVWDSWVSAGNEPARTTIEAKLTVESLIVEIGVIAAI
jgi:enamine deaminase RidA (YjgF/YER057c/UK114 family)